MEIPFPFRRTHLPWLVELVARLVVALLYPEKLS